MAVASTPRRRRIRQLEHCNPAVFGNVCLTPYQDLRNLHELHFVNVKMAASSDLTSIDSFKNQNKKRFQWNNGQAILLKSIKHGFEPANFQNNRKQLNFHDCMDSIQIAENNSANTYGKVNNCDECMQNSGYGHDIRENGDGACSCSDDEDYHQDYTNDTYYNLDFTMLEKRRCSILVDQLLLEIYSTYQAGITDYNSGTSCKSVKYVWMDRHQLAFKGNF